MERTEQYMDLLTERRKDCDIMWVSRSMNPLTPHRLPREITYTRSQMIRAALTHPRVVNVMNNLAVTKGVPRAVIKKEAEAILEEMASKAHLPTVRWIGILITKVLKRILISIRLNEEYLLFTRSGMQMAQQQYVYAPSHRSYLDFVLLSYILFSYDMALPNIASGMDFYRMRIVGELLRKTGAFYMRRSFSSDLLYKEIFRAYVSSLVSHSDRAIEFFIEGTRSRSQKSITPKFGLLAIILESLFSGEVGEIQFIPMSISYDKPLEELLFVYELLGVPKPAESTSRLFKSLSILKEAFANGHVYFKINEPIPATKFVHSSIRSISSLSPNAKLPTEVIEKLAYSIIDSHKRNTILTPFNIISLLYNEIIYTYPQKLYNFSTLLEDYCWLKKCMSETFKASVAPKAINVKKNLNEEEEIWESLKTHRDLLAFDGRDLLLLKERHRETQMNKQKTVKGHLLDEQTMRVAVPVINIAIYVNPTLAFLAKPAMVALSIGYNVTNRETASSKYFLLRRLLSTEFALPIATSEMDLQEEWEESARLLFEEDCLQVSNEEIKVSRNTKLFSILYNVLVPFVDAVRITCTVLSQWDESMGEINERAILKECQKTAEVLIHRGKGHPYILSLDLYTTTVMSLTNQQLVLSTDKKNVYAVDKSGLSRVISKLDQILNNSNNGAYLNILPLFNLQVPFSKL